MFRIFKKNITEMEKDDLSRIMMSAYEIKMVCDELAKIIQGLEKDGILDRKRTSKDDRVAHVIKTKLKRILRLLHNDKKLAKDAIREELKREKEEVVDGHFPEYN